MRLCQVMTLSGFAVDMSEVVSVVTLFGCSVDMSEVVSSSDIVWLFCRHE